MKEVNLAEAKLLIHKKQVSLFINVPSAAEYAKEKESVGFMLRRAAVDYGVSLITDLKEAEFLVMALDRHDKAQKEGREFFSYESWQELQKLNLR